MYVPAIAHWQMAVKHSNSSSKLFHSPSHFETLNHHPAVKRLSQRGRS